MSRKIPFIYEDKEIDPRYGQMVTVKSGNTVQGTLLPGRFKTLANAFYNFEYRSDDVSLSSYPKSGTTWAAAILWAMKHFDEMDRALTESVNHRFEVIDNDFLHDLPVEPYIKRLKAIRPEAKEEDGPCLQLAALEKGPRIIWCHLPFDLQNPDVVDSCKVVYVIRHPKDNMYSRYVHFTKVGEFNISSLAEEFMKGDTIYGGYWHHVAEAWKRKDHPNMHILFYEDMKADIMKELRSLNAFLGTDLTEEQLKKVADHTSFNNMKAHPSMAPDIDGFSGSFFNKGQVGSSKGQLPPEMDAKMDAWIKENSLKLDPNFKYAS